MDVLLEGVLLNKHSIFCDRYLNSSIPLSIGWHILFSPCKLDVIVEEVKLIPSISGKGFLWALDLLLAIYIKKYISPILFLILCFSTLPRMLLSTKTMSRPLKTKSFSALYFEFFIASNYSRDGIVISTSIRPLYDIYCPYFYTILTWKGTGG